MDSIEPMKMWRPARAVVVLVALALLGGCTSDDPEPSARSQARSPSPAASGAAGRPSGESGNSSPTPLPTRGEVTPPPEDRDSSGSGDTPAYTEMVEARITGGAKTFVLDARFRQTLPDRMPDRHTTMRVTFTLIATTKKRYSFIAQGSQRGWLAFSQGISGDEQFAGSLRVVGARIRMELPWTVIGTLDRFQWLANSAWDSSRPGGHRFSFDLFPNQGLAQYPSV